MPHAQRMGKTLFCAAVSALAVPGAASAQAPVPTLAPVPHAPSISLPVTVGASQPCPGAGRRSGRRARRVAIGCLVNRARTSAGLAGYRWSRRLARAATRHARDMDRRGYFAHQRAGGPSLSRRARRAGWRGRRIGEAIAYGCGRSGTPSAIVQSWLASPPHRAILLSGRMRRVGIGIAGPPVRCGRGATFVLDAG